MMLWLLVLTLPCLGGSVPVTSGETPCLVPQHFKVQLGRVRLSLNGSVRVARIICHPEYSFKKGAKGGADVALLKLQASVRQSNLVRWISLAPKSPTFPPGTRCWVTGWGDIGPKEPLPPPYNLQEVEVPIVADELCRQRYLMKGKVITDDMLCAGSWGRDSCQGDSGGPLVCKWKNTWVQVGVVSWGEKCGLPNFPGVYARVTSFLFWIHGHIHSSQ